MDISDGAYQRHLTDPQHLSNLAEQVDVSSSVFLTPPPTPPSPPHDWIDLADLDNYVPEFSNPNSPVFEGLDSNSDSEELHELPPPRSPRLEDDDHDPSVSSCLPWRYFNRASFLEGINEDRGNEDDDEPPIKIFKSQ